MQSKMVKALKILKLFRSSTVKMQLLKLFVYLNKTNVQLMMVFLY